MEKAVNSIRNSHDDELEFDLANYTEQKATDLMKACFEKPLERNTHLKVTFVVGGGKLVRQKYDDNLTKYVTNGLRAIGFEEDISADKSSSKVFKSQHDTSKNLKFVHVFPVIVKAAKNPHEEEDEEEDEEDLDIYDRILRVDCEDLANVLDSKIPSYSERKKLLSHLKDANELFARAETKMCNMESLDADEDKAYNHNNEIDEKIQLVNSKLSKMVENGELTSSEKNKFLSEMESKIDSVKAGMDSANDKKKKAMANQLKKLEEMKEKCEKSGVADERPLKREKEILGLMKKLFERRKMEESKESKSLSELKMIGEIGEIEEAIECLLNSAKGWFEGDEEFSARVENLEKQAKKSSGKKGKNSGYSGGSAWSTVKKR